MNERIVLQQLLDAMIALRREKDHLERAAPWLWVSAACICCDALAIIAWFITLFGWPRPERWLLVVGSILAIMSWMCMVHHHQLVLASKRRTAKIMGPYR